MYDYEEWVESKNRLPDLGMVVEGIGPKDWLYTHLGRDYFALVSINDKLIWITPSMTDFEYNELKIMFWRFIPPDPKGKRPFIKIKKYKKYWEPKIIWEKD